MGRPLGRLERLAFVTLASLAVVAAQQAVFPRAALAASGRPADSADSLDASDTLDITGLESRFELVGKRVSPSVVAISAAMTPCETDDTLRTAEMNPQKLQGILDKTTRTVGTGFVVDADGYILTNQHVIEDSEQFWVTTDDHRVFPAIVVGSDPRQDLAVLKIPARDLPPVRFADASSVRRGRWTIAIGNPYGLATEGEMALSVGVVSAVDRSLPKLASKENRLYTNLIQTTAQINPGNSGGPLFDIDGNVLGINTAVILPQKQTNGIGFAIPITPHLLAEVRELEQGHEVTYGYLGVTVSEPTPAERAAAGLKEAPGVRVDSVEPNSPASATLKPGDYIARIDGDAVRDSDHFVRLVGATTVDHPSQLEIYRDGRPVTLAVTPRRRPMQYAAVTHETQRMHWRGMVVGPIPANWTAEKTDKPKTGLMVVGIDDSSPMRRQGITTGSIINSVAGVPVSSLEELQKIINDLPPEKCVVETQALSSEVVSAKN